MKLRDIDTNLTVKALKSCAPTEKAFIHISFPFTWDDSVLKKISGKLIKLFPGHVQLQEFMDPSTQVLPVMLNSRL